MHQRLIHTYPLLRINHQHPAQQIPGLVSLQPAVLRAIRRKENVGKQFFESVARVSRSVFHIVSHGGLKSLHEIRGRCAELLYYFVPLVDICFILFKDFCMYMCVVKHVLRDHNIEVSVGVPDNWLLNNSPLG